MVDGFDLIIEDVWFGEHSRKEKIDIRFQVLRLGDDAERELRGQNVLEIGVLVLERVAVQGHAVRDVRERV